MCASILREGQSQGSLESSFFVNAVVHEGVIGELVPVQQVLQEVGAFVARVSPGHCRTDGAHHTVGVTAMALHTVLHQLLLIQIAGSTVGTSKGGPVGDIAGSRRH